MSMTLSAELAAAADGSRLLGLQVRAAGDRHGDAASQIGTIATDLPVVWVAPPSEYLEVQLQTLRSSVFPVAQAFAHLSASLLGLAAEARSLATQARHWEQVIEEARAELSRVVIGTPESIEASQAAAYARIAEAEAKLAEILESWNRACRARRSDVDSVVGPLHTLATTSVLLPDNDFVPQIGSFEYEVLIRQVAMSLSGRPPEGSFDPLSFAAGTWVHWTNFEPHVFSDWISYLMWVRGGADMARFPTVANGMLATHVLPRLVPAGALSFLSNPLVQAGARVFPLVGGLYTSATSGWRVLQSGGPRNAFRERGAGYTSDIGQMVLGGGVVAVVLVGTTPVWGTVAIGAVVVGGAVWVGSELVSHRETIGRWAGTAWDWGSGAVGWAWNTGGDVLGWGLDQGSSLAEWGWNSGSSAVGWGLDAGASVAGTVWDEGTDLAGDVWDAGSSAADTVYDNTVGRFLGWVS